MVGQKIKQIRNDLKLTQDVFAEKLGIPRTSIANYEIGNNSPSSNFIQKLVDTFNVNANFLFADDVDMFLVNHIDRRIEIFKKIFPGVTVEPELIEMIELCEVSVVRHEVLRTFVIAKEEYKALISKHYEQKQGDQKVRSSNE